jgi:predicted ATP-binding protein involved in virulence
MSTPLNPLRVNRLYMKGVGPFESLDLTFREKQHPDKADLHLLVGPNGSGKSTVLYALAAMFAPTDEAARLFRERLRSSASYATVRGEDWQKFADAPRPPHTPAPARVTPWADEKSLWHSLHPHMLVSEFINAATGKPRDEPLGFAAFAYAGQRGLTSYRLDAIREPARGPLVDALSFTSTADSATIVQWIATSHTKEALALRDGNTVAAERFRATRRQVEEAVREVIGEDIRFEMSYEPLGITLRRGGVAVDLEVLPDGVKSIVSWVADLLSRLDRVSWRDDVPTLDRTFLLLLDEVDIHLHPAWQRKVLPMVQRLFKNAQIVVSTHSPFVVASIADAWVYPFAVKDGVASLGEVLPSQAGASVASVLRTVFGVPEEFDVETEAELARFYGVRSAVLAGDTRRFDELKRLAVEAAGRGEEVEDIVASEVAQVANCVGLSP